MTNVLEVKSPIVVGVVGGIASGKSQVTRMLGKLNGTIISADEIAHRVLQEPDVIDSLVQLFGNSILTERSIDRKKLASMVFGDSEVCKTMRKKLEAIVHPRIRQLAKTDLETLKRDPNTRMIILDAPLLIEGGWLPYCDRIIYVDSPDNVRKKRAMERGWNAQEWQDRESAQMSLAEKKTYATDILLNNGTIEELTQRVLEFEGSLQGSP
ncbi:MAG TPA: dephospho-CoA kinase [Pirellula sp.]|nr:dephospho-CoA kinase [Pirellula sp.]